MRAFLPLVLLAAVAVADEPQGIDYLGAGYDLVFGNPDGSEASSSVTDPGFRVHLIKFNWDDGDNTCSGLNNNWTCPREVSIMPDTSCMQQSSSSAITSTKEFQEVLQQDCSVAASISGSYGGFSGEAAFSGSNSMSSMQKKILNEQVTTFQSKAICVEYTAVLKLGFAKSLLEPLPEFVSALGILPSTYNSCYAQDSVGGPCPQRVSNGFGDLPPVKGASRRLMAAVDNPVLASGGKFMLRSVSKKTMCVDDGGSEAGGNLVFHLWTCSADNMNQVFTYDAATSMIHSGSKDFCVDDGGGKIKGETSFRLKTCNATSVNQKFVYDGTTQMFRSSQKTGLCLDDGGGKTNGETEIHLWDCSQTNVNQQFSIEPLPTAPPVATAAPTKPNVNDCACDASVAGYFRFIQLFGTHYTTRVEMGGKIVHRLEIKSSDVSALQRNKVDVAYGASIKASYDGVVASGTVSAEVNGTRSKETEAFSKVMQVAQKEININVGGSPSEDWREWAKSTTQTPMPIRYRLSSLVDLIQIVDPAKVAPFEAAVQDYIAAYGKTLTSNTASNAKIMSVEIRYSLDVSYMGSVQFRVMIGPKGSMMPADITVYAPTGSFTVDVPPTCQTTFGEFVGKTSVTLQYVSGRFYPPSPPPPPAKVLMEAKKAQHPTNEKHHWINMEARLAMKGQVASSWTASTKFGLTAPESVMLRTIQVFAVMSDGTTPALGNQYSGEQLKVDTEWAINPFGP